MNRKTFLHMIKYSPTRKMKDDSYYLSDKELRQTLHLESPKQMVETVNRRDETLRQAKEKMNFKMTDTGFSFTPADNNEEGK